jgi:hypothetical protein
LLVGRWHNCQAALCCLVQIIAVQGVILRTVAHFKAMAISDNRCLWQIGTNFGLGAGLGASVGKEGRFVHKAFGSGLLIAQPRC